MLGLFFALLPNARSDQSIPKELLGSVVRITNMEQIACGSGVLINGGVLVTNSHLLESLCQEIICADGCQVRRCRGLRVQRAAAPGQPASEEVPGFEDVRILADLPGIDLALVSSSAPDGSRPELPLALGPARGSVMAIGFPGCGDLALQVGQIETFDPIRLYTSALGNYGSSGGALFDASNALVGVVDQAADLRSALKGKLLRSDFPLSGINAGLLAQALKNPENSREIEIKALLDYYRAALLNRHGLSRLIGGMLFSSDVGRLLSAESRRTTSLDTLKLIGAANVYPGQLFAQNQPVPGNDHLYDLLETLVLANSLENYGANHKFLMPINAAALLKNLEHSAHQRAQIDQLVNLITEFNRQEYPGFQLYLLELGLLLAFLLIVLTPLWAFSLGLVWAGEPGGFLWRLFTICWVGLLWPISLMLWWIFKKVRS
ncbi:MAG: serine protease [Oligoflexia bacterium]|nr:serine protease [Oligoflexia bacterium]